MAYRYRLGHDEHLEPHAAAWKNCCVGHGCAGCTSSSVQQRGFLTPLTPAGTAQLPAWLTRLNREAARHSNASGPEDTILDGAGRGVVFRCGAVLALLAWITITLGGTVPINEAASGWDPDAPPPTWRAQVDRWERLNSVRVWLAVGAFALMLAAAALHAHGG